MSARVTRVTRRPPPLWILLDILMVWVLVLVSMPVDDGGVSYKFLGLPPGSVLFKVQLPVQTDQRRWTHFDFGGERWVSSTAVTPHGLENFICEECAAFLPDGAPSGDGLMLGVPSNIHTRIHETFGEACLAGDCDPTLYIDASGKVSLDPRQ